jgi:hypothetical protein
MYRHARVHWNNITKAYLIKIKKDLEDLIVRIEENNFPGNPSSKTCKYCEYKNCCVDWTKYKVARMKNKDTPSQEVVGGDFTVVSLVGD